MKQMSKRILALLCVTVMLFTTCLSSFTFAAAAAEPTTQSENALYGTKWTIFYSETGEKLDYKSGARFEFGKTGFNAVIPETYTMNDLAVYIHMTLDTAAVTAFEKGGSVELSQATMDQAERYWQLSSLEWKVGDNAVLLPLGSSGSAPGSAGVAFDLYQPINFFRMFADPNKSEFTADSSVTIWEIAIVDKTAAGVQFGENDTYLKLSNPITATPNTIEASVKVDPVTNEWQIGNGFTSSKGFRTTWSNGTSAVTYNNLWETDDTMSLQPAAGTPYAEFKPNGKTNTSGSDTVWCPVYTEEFTALDLPKSVELNDLVFSGWMYVSDASAVKTTSPWIWLASSGSYSTSNGGLTYKNMWVDYPLKDGWNYFELPLSQWAPSSSSYPLYKDDISGISVRAIDVKWQEGTIEDQVTVRYADFKLSLAEKEEEEEEEEEEEVINSWQLAGGFTSSSGFNTGWSSGSSNSTYGNKWVTDASLAKQPAAGTVYAEFTAKGNTASSGVWSPVFTWAGSALNIPEGAALSDLKFSMWMYISDASALATPSPNFKIGSTASSVDQGLSYSNLFKNFPLMDGWNYIEFPLSAGTQTGTGPLQVDDICKFTMRSLNLTWLDSTPDDGVAGTVADQAIVRYADFKISLIDRETATEWNIGVPNGGRYEGMTNIGVGIVGVGEEAPVGTKYYAVTVGKDCNWAMSHQSFKVEFPSTLTSKDQLFLCFWLYTSTGEIGSGNIELTSSGTWDKEELCFTYQKFISSAKAGWNYVELPLASPTSTSGEFNYKNVNFIRWVGGSKMTAETEIRISEMKLVFKQETTAENEQMVFPTSKLGTVKWSNGSDGLPSGMPYVEKDLSANTATGLVMQPAGVDVKFPADTSINDLVFSFWLWVNDVDNISGTGQIELTSSGTCDQQELGYTINKATLKDGWNHIVLPLSRGTLYSGSQGVAFDHTAINYMRWYGLYGTNLKVKFSHFSIYLVEDEENPSWSIMNFSIAPHNWDGGSMTTGLMWTDDGSGDPNQPLDGTVYMEVKPGSGYDEENGRRVWKAGWQAGTGSGFIAPNIPSYYTAEDLNFNFKIYIPDADTLVLNVSNTPNFGFSSAGGYSSEYVYTPYLFRDYVVGEWKDGWNQVSMPMSKLVGSADFDIHELNYMRWTYMVQYEDTSIDQMIRYADFRITANVDKTPVVAEPVSVTEDDMIIIGNTNTADENPIALFLNMHGNVCWVWGDKQYNTEYNAATGEWVDLALVRDTAAGMFYLYANGELVEWRDATGTTDIVPTVAFSIGADGLGDVMRGMIADVRLWSDVRTAAEIVANRVSKVGNKTAGFTADEQGLIDAWFLVGDLSHVLGDSVTDSIKGNDLVFKGSRADDWLDYDLTQHDFLYDAEGNPNYYTMVFIPDIQNLVTGKYTEWWMAEAQWIADNVESENIIHVMGAGDSTWNNAVAEYTRARAGFDLFADKVSWSNVIGNHDYVWTAPKRDTTNYNNYFGLDYILSTEGGKNFVGYFEDPYGISGVENAYYRFKVNGVQWMILQLEFHPRAHVLTWANEILAQYPHDNVILTTHSYLNGSGNYAAQSYKYIDGTEGVKGSLDELYGGYIGNDTEKVWTEVAYKNPNVKMVLCGHSASSDCSIVYREDANVAGYKVPQMMINAQNLDNSDNQTGGYFDDLGVGLLGIMRFSADGTQVAMQYYSPYYDLSYGTTSNDITLTLDIDTTCVHENTTTTTVDADCDTEGSVTVTCDDCGVVVSTETTPATGHINTTTNTTPATCVADGLTTVTCECGTVVSTTVIPALGHDDGTLEGATDATNTEPGYTGNLVCGVCGDVIEEGTVIPTLIPGEIVNGVYRENGKYFPYKGLILVDGYYYYVGNSGKVMKDVNYTITDTNGYEALDSRIQKQGSYYFDENGHMVFEKNGLYGGRYYEDDKLVPYAGLIEWEGNLYYIGDYARPITGRYYITNLNGLIEKAGSYYFDENGAMVETGVYDGYYYQDGKITPYAGMVEFNDDVYFVGDQGAVKTGRYAPGTLNGYAKGTYYFNGEGKMQTNVVVDGYYYGEDGRCVSYAGLVEVDGAYYYVGNYGKVIVDNAKFYVTTTNGLVNKGYYAFDAEGKMSADVAYVKTAEQFAAALAEGKDIVLEANINLGDKALTVAKDTTLNLNGYVLSGVCNENQGHMLMVNNGVTLNVLDSSAAQTSKITYASGASNVGWAIDLNGTLNLYSGTIELTGSWSIGYAVDVRPNAWGSDYKAATVFTMYGGLIESSDGAIRVASSSDDAFTSVSAHFVMNGGAIVAGWDGVFIQQSNSAYDILNVELNAGSITASYAPIRFYGPNASSVVGNAEKPMSLTVGDCDLALDTPSSLSGWYTEDILIGGGMSVENLEKYATLNLS